MFLELISGGSSDAEEWLLNILPCLCKNKLHSIINTFIHSGLLLEDSLHVIFHIPVIQSCPQQPTSTVHCHFQSLPQAF